MLTSADLNKGGRGQRNREEIGAGATWTLSNFILTIFLAALTLVRARFASVSDASPLSHDKTAMLHRLLVSWWTTNYGGLRYQMCHSACLDKVRLSPKSPDMKTTFCRCCQSVLWATFGVRRISSWRGSLFQAPRQWCSRSVKRGAKNARGLGETARVLFSLSSKKWS